MHPFEVFAMRGVRGKRDHSTQILARVRQTTDKTRILRGDLISGRPARTLDAKGNDAPAPGLIPGFDPADPGIPLDLGYSGWATMRM